jgi:hypothetical protein
MLSLSLKAKLFSSKPSSFFSGLSGYEAYCLDSACALFLAYWEAGKRPIGTVDPSQDARSFL